MNKITLRTEENSIKQLSRANLKKAIKEVLSSSNLKYKSQENQIKNITQQNVKNQQQQQQVNKNNDQNQIKPISNQNDQQIYPIKNIVEFNGNIIEQTIQENKIQPKKETKKEFRQQKTIVSNTQYNYIIPEITRESQINNFSEEIQLDLFKKEDKAPAPQFQQLRNSFFQNLSLQQFQSVPFEIKQTPQHSFFSEQYQVQYHIIKPEQNDFQINSKMEQVPEKQKDCSKCSKCLGQELSQKQNIENEICGVFCIEQNLIQRGCINYYNEKKVNCMCLFVQNQLILNCLNNQASIISNYEKEQEEQQTIINFHNNLLTNTLTNFHSLAYNLNLSKGGLPNSQSLLKNTSNIGDSNNFFMPLLSNEYSELLLKVDLMRIKFNHFEFQNDMQSDVQQAFIYKLFKFSKEKSTYSFQNQQKNVPEDKKKQELQEIRELANLLMDQGEEGLEKIKEGVVLGLIKCATHHRKGLYEILAETILYLEIAGIPKRLQHECCAAFYTNPNDLVHLNCQKVSTIFMPNQKYLRNFVNEIETNLTNDKNYAIGLNSEKMKRGDQVGLIGQLLAQKQKLQESWYNEKRKLFIEDLNRIYNSFTMVINELSNIKPITDAFQKFEHDVLSKSILKLIINGVFHNFLLCDPVILQILEVFKAELNAFPDPFLLKIVQQFHNQKLEFNVNFQTIWISFMSKISGIFDFPSRHQLKSGVAQNLYCELSRPSFEYQHRQLYYQDLIFLSKSYIETGSLDNESIEMKMKTFHAKYYQQFNQKSRNLRYHMRLYYTKQNINNQWMPLLNYLFQPKYEELCSSCYFEKLVKPILIPKQFSYQQNNKKGLTSSGKIEGKDLLQKAHSALNGHQQIKGQCLSNGIKQQKSVLEQFLNQSVANYTQALNISSSAQIIKGDAEEVLQSNKNVNQEVVEDKKKKNKKKKKKKKTIDSEGEASDSQLEEELQQFKQKLQCKQIGIRLIPNVNHEWLIKYKSKKLQS